MRFFSKICASLLALCLSVSFLPVQSSWADDEAPGSETGGITADTPMPDLVALQEKVDEASAIYDETAKRVAEVEAEIVETNKHIQELQAQLPDARERSNAAIREYYRMHSSSNPFLELVLGATSVADFFAKVEYSTRANQSFMDEMNSLSRLNDELQAARDELEAKKKTFEEEQLRAEEALHDAEHAREVAEDTAFKIAEATAAATAAEAEAAAAAAAEQTPEVPVRPDPGSGSGTGGGTTPPADPGTPEAPSDKQAFVNLWAPRIDAYMAGSPMAGYGYAFASAAYDYNVDPRWSPAIACMESSKGLYCFHSHNAWGWGFTDWPDWETAIYAHVGGLSRGYGYTISEAAAKKYCPFNWEHWYTTVSNQMTLI